MLKDYQNTNFVQVFLKNADYFFLRALENTLFIPNVNLLKYYMLVRYFFISWILLPATDYNGHRRIPLSCSIKRRNHHITSSIMQPIKLKLDILL